LKKSKETILGWLIFIGLVSHYVFGYFFWDKLEYDRVYCITAYFCMDIWGLVVFIIANKKVLKGAGCLGMILGTYYFYMEFNDPFVWAGNDYKGLATLALLIVNLFFLWYFTDIFKKLKI